MKVTVNGAGVNPGAVCDILEDLEKEYGLKIRDLTMYIRFVDDNGRIVDPKLPANGDELIMKVEKNESAAPKEFEYDEQMKKDFDNIKGEFLSVGIEEDVIKRAFEYTLLQHDMKVPRTYLRHIVQTFDRMGIRTAKQVSEFMKKTKR